MTAKQAEAPRGLPPTTNTPTHPANRNTKTAGPKKGSTMTILKQGTGGQGAATKTPSEFQIQQELARARQDWMRDAGIDTQPTKQYTGPIEHPFTSTEREHVTLLFGGLTFRHDSLVRAAAQGLGYNVETIPTPQKTDFQAGKEYGNNAQCNPTYFTVGALVNQLKRLRDIDGLSTEDIYKNYVFVTAGACGPCRFGMYESEFRLALRNAGFDGFRVLLFQQKGGMEQSGGDAGLDLNIDFALALLNGLFIGDILNEIAYQIRPYETTPGQTDKVFKIVLDKMQTRMATRDIASENPGLRAKLAAALLAPITNPRDIAKVIAQLTGNYYLETLRECRELINQSIEVDYTRPKPICKITGEFWAQTTEGDGNYHLFDFLESQGAEVIVEPLVTWVTYLIAQSKMKVEDQRGLHDAQGPLGHAMGTLNRRLAHLRLNIAKRIVVREYGRIRAALGNTAHAPVCQLELQRLGHPYYNRKSGGGEGHLEVAKNIFYANHALAHMVMSLKPFGCMPSTQSDGAQAAVTTHFPGMIYIPIETSGEGDINAHSRAQMALGEAKTKCKEEFNACLEKTGYTIEAIRAFCQTNPELRKPLQNIPHAPGVTGKAANFILHVAKRMDRAPKNRNGEEKGR